MTFRRWLTFLLWSLVATLTGLLMLIYFFFLALVFVLKWLSLLWEILIVSISIDFSLNSKQDAPFHCIAYDYSRADWDGLRDHLRDVLGEDIFKLGASAAASEVCDWVHVGIDVCIPHRKYQVKPHQQLFVLLDSS